MVVWHKHYLVIEDLITYEHLVKNEQTARKFVLGFCWKNQQRFCPRCNTRKLYRLSDHRYRCSECKYTFHDFSGRWINHGSLSCQQWLRIVKLFELEQSVRKIASQLNLDYGTAYKAVTTIRLAILTNQISPPLGSNLELDESYFGGHSKGNRGRGAAGKVPVFGILQQQGKVVVEVVPDVSVETLVELTVKKVRRGSIIYTDKFRSYDSLMCCGYRHLKVDHGKQFVKGRVHINGLEGFWSWTKERLMKHHGVSKETFPLYLKELEFRYNNRDQDIFKMIVLYLSTIVPNHH